MKFIRLIFKIIAAPLVVVLTVITPVFAFLFCWASTFMGIVSGLGALISIALFIMGQYLGGGVFLLLSFLIFPFGIPAIAERLIGRAHSLNYSLRDFIMS